MPSGEIRQIKEYYEEDSARWVFPFPDIPKGWMPPQNFNLAYDFWLIPKPFISATNEETGTREPSFIHAKPFYKFQKVGNQEKPENCELLPFEVWRTTHNVTIRLQGPSFKDVGLAHGKRHFELIPAMDMGKTHPSELKNWTPDMTLEDLRRVTFDKCQNSDRKKPPGTTCPIVFLSPQTLLR